MTLSENIAKGMETVNAKELAPEGCLLCGFCDLYRADKQKCSAKSIFKSCAAGKGNILVRATLLGSKTEFHHAYCRALNASVLISLWNYAQENITTQEGAVGYIEDLEACREGKDLRHFPSVENLGLGAGFASETSRAWKCLMTYQVQKRSIDNKWWMHKAGGLQHATNTFGNPKSKVSPEELRSQDEVPRNRLIHYIVKDYRRMFNNYNAVLSKGKEQQREIDRLQKELLKDRDNMLERQQEWNRKEKKYEKTIAELQNSRKAVVEAVTDDLQQQVKELERKNRLLAEAVINPEKTNEAVRVVTLSTSVSSPAEREWMKRSAKQLDKASNDLITAKERLVSCMEGFEKAYAEGFVEEDVKKMLKKYTSTLSKIEAATNHIGVFFEKIEGIEFE